MHSRTPTGAKRRQREALVVYELLGLVRIEAALIHPSKMTPKPWDDLLDRAHDGCRTRVEAKEEISLADDEGDLKRLNMSV